MASPAHTPAHPFPEGLGNPVCVFCASSAGNEEMYTTAAQSLGEALAAERIPVVYGGGRRGIMGVISQSTLAAGGHVHGVLPKALVTRASEFTPRPGSSAAPTPLPPQQAVSAEGKGADLLAEDYGGRLTMEVVGSMHEMCHNNVPQRKAKMAKLSTGGFVVLPGGFGTLEELFEMVTWNQVGDRTAGQRAARGLDIGMHALPVIVLNIGNYYSPMKDLIANGVRTGFISEKNASLVQIIDLGDAAANNDNARAAEWGPLALKTLKEWSWPSGAGYGFKWENDEKEKTKSTSTSTPASGTASTAGPTTHATSEVPYLFSTARYTCTDPAAEVTPDDVPLWPYHVARLRNAHARFVAAEGKQRWGAWVGDDAVWDSVRAAIVGKNAEGAGDWRLRIVLHPGPKLETQILPAPPGLPPYSLIPPTTPQPTRALYLDPQPSPTTASELAYRQYKTSRRDVYASAAARVGGEFPEVVLHADGELLEGTTTNIAMLLDGVWVTPRITESSPILAGTARAYLLDTGVIREGTLTVHDWDKAMRGEVRVIAFNGLRGLWEGKPTAPPA